MNNPILSDDVITTVKNLLTDENASEEYQLGVLSLGSELLGVSIDTMVTLTS